MSWRDLPHNAATMSDAFLPTEFDWVRARSNCSLPVIFKVLHLGAQNDVQTMGSLAVAAGQPRFSVTPMVRGRFSVVREDGAFPESVNFVLANGAITAQDDQGTVLVAATITLNNAGQCRLKVETEELEQWQFRRKTLEKLFFEPRAL